MIGPQGTKSPTTSLIMTRTYTEQAIHIIERQLKVAKRDGGVATNRHLKFTSKGYILTKDGRRISSSAAVQMIAAALEAEETAKRTPNKNDQTQANLTWDKLNQATKDFFIALCEQMQEHTKDAGMTTPAPVKLLSIGLKNAPRLTNAKKCGLIQTITGRVKTEKLLVLTDDGRKIFLTTIGNS